MLFTSKDKLIPENSIWRATKLSMLKIHFSKLFTFLVILALASSEVISQKEPSSLQSKPVQFPFQRIMWTSWNSDTGETPIIVQICIENMAKVAKQNNFTLILLNESNVRTYIKDYDQLFVQVRKNTTQKAPSSASDMLRLLIIEQHGGIWFDTTTILLNGMDELKSIASDEYRHMVVNRFSEDPEAMLFYYSVGQNRIQHYTKNPVNPTNRSQMILFNEYPHYELWSMFAKKNSTYIHEVRKTFSQFTVTQFLQMQKKFIDEDIYINEVDNYRDYLYVDMAADYVLQRKQFELDQGLTMFGQRKYAFEYYKLWGMHAEYGPMLTVREDLLPYEHLFRYSREQLEEKGFSFRFFMKQFGSFREAMTKKFDLLMNHTKNNTITFEQFLNTQTNRSLCDDLTFIVKESIMSELLINSTILQRYGIPIISQEQNDKWQSYCNGNQTFWTKLQKKLKPYIDTFAWYYNTHYKVPRAKVQSILHKNQHFSFQQWFEIIFNDNAFLLYDLIYLSILTSILFGIYFFVKFLVNIAIRKIITFRLDSEAISSQHSPRELGHPNEKTTEKSDESHEIKPITSISHVQRQREIYFLTFLIFLLSLVMFNAVDCLGGREQPETIFLCVLVIFIGQSYVEGRIQKMESYKRSVSEIKYFYGFFYMMINYMTAYLCLVHMRRNRFYLNWFAQVLGIIGPCILKLKQIVQEAHSREKRQSWADKSRDEASPLSYVKQLISRHYCRFTIIAFLLTTLIIPNLRYIAIPQGYIIKYIPLIPTIYLSIQFISVTIKCLKKCLWFQILRLLLLLGVALRLQLIYYEYDLFVGKYMRISFVSMLAIAMALVYTGMGSEVELAKRQESLIWGQNYCSHRVIQWVLLVVPACAQIVVALFVWYHDRMGFGIKVYWMHFLLFALNAFISVLVSLIIEKKGDSPQDFRTLSQAPVNEEEAQQEYE